MKVLFDTSVLVAAMIDGHPRHERAFHWLDRARKGSSSFFVAAHSVAELYAVLSTYPTRPRLSPGVAATLVRENVAAAQVVPLSAKDYLAIVAELAERSLAGGVVYDALVARAAQKAGVDHLLTLNPVDFLRVWPQGERIIATP